MDVPTLDIDDHHIKDYTKTSISESPTDGIVLIDISLGVRMSQQHMSKSCQSQKKRYIELQIILVYCDFSDNANNMPILNFPAYRF